jgi:hypothetical protein
MKEQKEQAKAKKLSGKNKAQNTGQAQDPDDFASGGGLLDEERQAIAIVEVVIYN